MKTINILTLAGLSLVTAFAGACSPGSAPSNTAPANRVGANANTTAANASTAATDETPALVRTAFPDAQSFTTQHKDIPADAVTDIEQDTGGKVPDKDHHSYLAFSTAGGKRTQVGAATVLKAGGKDVLVIYDSKAGSPVIREVRADGVSPEFLKQFAGKGHDNEIAVGGDITAKGVDEATAKAVTQAVRIDVLTMQALYGSAHSH